MEFLVKIEVEWPADGDPVEFARLTAAERVRGAELGAAGTIRRMWRVPGRRANWDAQHILLQTKYLIDKKYPPKNQLPIVALLE